MKIQWNGKNETLVRLNPGEEKASIKAGDQFEVSEQRGEELLKYSRDFQAVTGVVDEARVDKGYIDLKKKIMACETIEDVETLKNELSQEGEKKKEEKPKKENSKKEGEKKK